MARKDEIIARQEKMRNNNILFVFIYILEAHANNTWPAYLDNAPKQQETMDERLERAKQFYEQNVKGNGEDVFHILADSWENEFETTYICLYQFK